jgi:hypothetical protein
MLQVSQVNDLQKEALYELGINCKPYDYKGEVPEIISILSSASVLVAELALGKIGKKLIEFINTVDLNHPDLPHAVETIFLDSQCLQQTQEVLELAEKCKHLSSITSNFHKLVNRHCFSKSFLQSTPFSPRLWKSKQELNAIRKNRKMQKVDLKELYKNGNAIWNRLPTDLSIYNRNKLPYLKEIEESERKLDRLIDLGCTSTADKITAEVKQLRINLSHRYCGFNRVKVLLAAAILARMHGYKLRTTWDIHDNQKISVVIPNNLLYDFQPDESELPSLMFASTYENYQYEARIYPVHQLYSTASEELIRVLDHLDNFPDMNNKVLFDDLLILVPSVKLNNYNGTYFVKDQEGNILGFDSEEDATIFLDKILIQNGLVSALLGERDGICYFICYWIGDNNGR